MPFRAIFKKTRRYDVSSKNSYVVGIHMLDNSFVECSLSTGSYGQECLDSIAQKYDVKEGVYFGLRYVTKKLQFRWVDLDRPLKKQLDKFAQSPRLHFGVMYYIPCADRIADDNARYQYFLQLKNDLIDEKLTCSLEQAKYLAAYSLQAEFGDHIPTQHTPEAFMQYPLLPSSLTNDLTALYDILTDVLSIHQSLTGVHPVTAEVQFIKEVQGLSGYGMEYYIAKDASSKEVCLETSYFGISANYLDGYTKSANSWPEISSVNHSAQVVSVVLNPPSNASPVQYFLEDRHTAKYFCSLCSLQKQFYTSNKVSLSVSNSNSTQESIPTQPDIPDIQLSAQVSYSATDITESQTTKDPEDTSLSGSGNFSLTTSNEHLPNYQILDILPPDAVYQNNYSTYPSDPQASKLLHGQTVDREALLPAYRPTPDYETVMQQRILQKQLQYEGISQEGTATNAVYTFNGSGSHPEIYAFHQQTQSMNVYTNMNVIESQSVPRQYIYSTYSTPDLYAQIHPTIDIPAVTIHQQPYYTKLPPPYPKTSSSTPDLATKTYSSTNSPDLVSRKNIRVNHPVDPSGGDATTSQPDVTNVQISHKPSKSAPAVISHRDNREGEKEVSGSDKTKAVQLRYIAPNDAPPPTKFTHIAIRRESFRRQMIANMTSPDNERDRESTTRSGLSPIEDTSGSVNNLTTSLASKSADVNSPDCHPDSTKKSSPRSRTSPGKKTKSNISPSKLLITDIDSCSQMSEVAISEPLTRSASLHQNQRLYRTNRSSTRSNVSTDRARRFRRCNPNVGGLRSPDIAPFTEEHYDTQSSLSPSHSSPAVDDDISVTNTDSDMLRDMSLHSNKDDEVSFKRLSMAPLHLAALNGLNFSSPALRETLTDDQRAPTDDRRKMLESRIAEGAIFSEFEEIPRKFLDMETTTASLAENECRNRYRDVLPYEANRVKLTTRYDNDTGYINASHIKLSHGGEQWWFIASQAPMDITVEDFWQMVWEYNVHVVAMLTDAIVSDKRKCSQYWPEDTGEEHYLDLENFDVILQYRSDSLYYVTNTIILRYKPLNKQRQIWHLQYTAWPDHGCPEDIFGFLGFLDEIDSMQRLAESESDTCKKFPIVIHCTAGVGRTGVVILTEIMKSCLELNQSIDLAKALKVLRQQRMFMVQTVGQYSFVYRTLIQYLKNTRLI